FPADLTRDLAREQGFQVDMEGYWRIVNMPPTTPPGKPPVFNPDALAAQGTEFPSTTFLGYGQPLSEAKVLAIYQGENSQEFARAGDEVTILLDQPPFYAESGGQVGDTGMLTAPAGDTTCALKITVTDTKKNALGIYLHSAKVEEGEVSVGQTVLAQIDAE